MNSSWSQFYKILHKQERWIIGLMSGTSLDGLDIALCLITGNGLSTKVELKAFETVSYTNEFKTEMKKIFSRRDADLQLVCLMNEKIAEIHAVMVLNSIKKWRIKAEDIDVIASHGQTIFHAPKSLHQLPAFPNGTLQIGDGDHLAVKTGIVTICDFRQKHLAAGGEGAPLAVYGDYLLFSKKGEVRLMLNIGGIANFTYLPADQDASKIFSTDIGPGNTLMDQYVQDHFEGLYFDKDANIASRGSVNESLLKELMNEPFLHQQIPKTTGPELFNLNYLVSAQQRSGTELLSTEDVLATLCRFTAEAIIQSISCCLASSENVFVYLSGGGMHNPLLLNYMKIGLPNVEFLSTADLGVSPDAKEAVLFAILANETLVGSPIDFGKRKGVPSVCMGKICLPN